MSNGLPDDADSLREKARMHRATAAAELDHARRRAFMLIAAEYERLADAVEIELSEAMNPGERVESRTRSHRSSN